MTTPGLAAITAQSGLAAEKRLVQIIPAIDPGLVVRVLSPEAFAHLTEDGRAHALEHHLVSVGELGGVPKSVLPKLDHFDRLR